MRALILVCMVLSGTAMAADLPRATPEEVGFDPERFEHVGKVMRAQVDEGRQAGIAWAVARRGQVVAMDGYGVQAVGSDVPMTPDTIVRLYSMTRAITSVTALRLMEEGRLDLRDDIADYIPAFRDTEVLSTIAGGTAITVPRLRPITVFQTMTHTAGFGYSRDYPKELGLERDTIQGLDQSLEDGINALASFPLLFQPGAKWKYGYSTDVLGRLVEVASGQDIEDAMRDRVLDPLGMADTAYFIPGSKADRFAGVSAISEDGTLVDATARVPASSGYTKRAVHKSGGGGLSSTTADYMAFVLMLANGGELNGARVLSPASVDYLRQVHIPNPEEPFLESPYFAGYGFGLGFGVLADPITQGQPSYAGEYRWGGLAGTWFWVDPTTEVSAVIMTQQFPGDDGIARDMRQAVYQALTE